MDEGLYRARSSYIIGSTCIKYVILTAVTEDYFVTRLVAVSAVEEIVNTSSQLAN